MSMKTIHLSTITSQRSMISRLFDAYNSKMKLEEESRSGSESVLEEVRLQNTPFTYKRHKNTYYIPVYPRAFIEEVVNIDYDRRTVTAKFVLMVTVCLKVDSSQLRQFLREHLILQFGYNQILFIPEHITLQNSPFLISRVPTHDRDYVNYRISGAIECAAEFDSMFFPYRRIEVTNHLCIRQQEFRQRHPDGSHSDYSVRYNIMMLVEENHEKYAQFLPYSGSKMFGNFKIDQNSSQAVADVDHHSIHTHLEVPEIIRKIYQFVSAEQKQKQRGHLPQKKRKSLIATIAGMGKERNSESEWVAEGVEGGGEWAGGMGEDEADDLEPFQHIGLRFTMSSISVGFVWQQEVPIWVLSVVTLFLFEAQPNIGNKFSSIILLLVSYISIISNFRRNNTAQQVLTFFQAKLMTLTLVPILLIITTAIDYYHADLFMARPDQVSNPFAIASIVIVLASLALTLAFLLFLWITKFLCEQKPRPVKADDVINWVNMVELEWGHHKLECKMKDILRKSQDKMVFSFHHSVLCHDSHEEAFTIDLSKVESKAVAVRQKGLTVNDD